MAVKDEKLDTGGWRVRLAQLSVAALARLPLGANRALGAAGGALSWYLPTRARRVTLHNLALCFPGMPRDERHELARRSLVQTGLGATETAWCWRRPLQDWMPGKVRIHGMQRYRDALAQGRGVLVATPHIGAWESGMPITAVQAQTHYFYRPPRDASLEPLMREGRKRLCGQPLRLDAGGIRHALKLLRAGRPVGILPDQEPDPGAGVFAPLFGTQALTMTLLTRLAARSGAAIVFLVVERCPDGWRAHFLDADEHIGATDATLSATAINRSVERCVAIAPEQYLWSYRRFRELPQGGRRDYRARTD